MREPVTIVDREVLKVLSVETRMDILKMLSEGARTPSHLSNKLNKSDATIVEHLEVLAKAGLVKKVEQPGKKWVFYTLTERGEGIVSSKSRRLVIILATSALAFVGGVGSFLRHYTQANYLATQGTAAPLAATEKAVGEVAVAFPTYLYLSVALFAVGLIGFSFYFYQKSKIKGVKL